MRYPKGSEESELIEIGCYIVAANIFAILLQILIGWNLLSGLIYVTAPTLWFFLPLVVFEGMGFILSKISTAYDEARLNRKKENALRMQEARARDKEEERLARIRKQAEFERLGEIEKEKIKEKKRKAKSFIKNHPVFVEFVKKYCSLFIFKRDFIRVFAFVYAVPVLLTAIALMIDGILLDGKYEKTIWFPMEMVLTNDYFLGLQSFTNYYQDLLLLSFILMVSLYFYGKAKIKVWDNISNQK